jgi:programmed cell death protein 5
LAQEEEPQNEEQQMRKALSKRLKDMQIEQQKRNVVKRFLTPDAYERLMNVRVANYELYSQLMDLIIAMAQSNKLYAKLTEAQLKDILGRLTQKPETKIEFKHK